jgi:hypothetical protein
VLSGAQVNQILGIVLGTEPLVKRPRTGVSPNKPLNPQPLASAAPRTRAMTKATTIIDIQDDPEPETFPSTFIIDHPPPPLQLPNLITTSPHHTITSEPMQLDPARDSGMIPTNNHRINQARDQKFLVLTPNPSEPSTVLDALNLNT